MIKLFAATFYLAWAAVPGLRAQNIQISRRNRTISVAASQTISEPSGIAVVHLAYVNYASNSHAAYISNGRIAGKILHTLLHHGVLPKQIQTSAVQLSRQQQNPIRPLVATPATTQTLKYIYRAYQAWQIRVPAAQAQTVLDLAMAAGANRFTRVEWLSAHPRALAAHALNAALLRAHQLAMRLAAQLHARLGPLLYASNYRAPYAGIGFGGSTNLGVTQALSVSPEKPILRLFPQKVQSTATVYAVFAIE